MSIYQDTALGESTFERTFSRDVDTGELIFHKDKKDREILKCDNEGEWMLQMDNEIPKVIQKGVFIPKDVYHRLIKGSGDLRVLIKEYD